MKGSNQGEHVVSKGSVGPVVQAIKPVIGPINTYKVGLSRQMQGSNNDVSANNLIGNLFYDINNHINSNYPEKPQNSIGTPRL